MIDWDYVKQLEADIGTAEFNNVVALFLDEVDSEVELLRTAVASADTLKSKMHFLKGSAYYLGFTEFGDICTRNEILAGTGSPEKIDLARLIAVYEQARLQFLKDAPKHCGFVAAA